MRVLIDINVMLDFLQRREPFFEASASLMDEVLYGRVEGVLPAHGITTINYFLTRGTGRERGGEVMRWLLGVFQIAPSGRELLHSALALPMTDYEDAVAALSALQTGCSHIVTRNIGDFDGSPVPAILPADFLRFRGRG